MSHAAHSALPSLRLLGALVVALAVVSSLLVVESTAAPSASRSGETPTAGTSEADFPQPPEECYDPDQPAPIVKCTIVRSGKSRPRLVLWGDSHAWQYLPAVRAQAEEHRVNLVLFAAGGCPPTLKQGGGYYVSCDATNRAALDYVVRLKDRGKKVRVLLGSYWSYYRIGYRLMKRGERDTPYREHVFRLQHRFTRPLFQALAKSRVPFDLIGQSAAAPEDAPPCKAGDLPYQCDLERRVALPLEKNTRAWLRGLSRGARARHQYLDTSAAYCDASTCRSRVRGTNVYYDRIHLGAEFTGTMSAYFERPFERLAPGR